MPAPQPPRDVEHTPSYVLSVKIRRCSSNSMCQLAWEEIGLLKMEDGWVLVGSLVLSFVHSFVRWMLNDCLVGGSCWECEDEFCLFLASRELSCTQHLAAVPSGSQCRGAALTRPTHGAVVGVLFGVHKAHRGLQLWRSGTRPRPAWVRSLGLTQGDGARSWQPTVVEASFWCQGAGAQVPSWTLFGGNTVGTEGTDFHEVCFIN